jgi:hypothetical protein
VKTHVIILCQGKQSRLPGLPVAKQMLPLPACGDVPILHRTIRQLWRLLGMAEAVADSPITVVGSLAMSESLISAYGGVRVDDSVIYHPNTQTLRDPGNSSLRGIDRYLSLPPSAMVVREWDRRVVLLGDVVYSWACLRTILDVSAITGTNFVGTSDLSRSAGELWGIAWTAAADRDMRAALAEALMKHPPFEEYQPGQMRRWLWAQDDLYADRARMTERPWFRAVDDYTRDIDLPEHVAMLPALSEAAKADDDAANGMNW